MIFVSIALAVIIRINIERIRSKDRQLTGVSEPIMIGIHIACPGYIQVIQIALFISIYYAVTIMIFDSVSKSITVAI